MKIRDHDLGARIRQGSRPFVLLRHYDPHGRSPAVEALIAGVPVLPVARCLRHSLLIRQPICVRAATRTLTARLG